VSKVGQWGQLKFKGGLLQKDYNVNKLNYPKPKIRLLTKEYLVLQIITPFTKIQQYTKIQRSVSVQQFAKHAPIALTLLDRLHWLQSQKALKNQRK
jgi:hypothetical protein